MLPCDIGMLANLQSSFTRPKQGLTYSALIPVILYLIKIIRNTLKTIVSDLLMCLFKPTALIDSAVGNASAAGVAHGPHLHSCKDLVNNGRRLK